MCDKAVEKYAHALEYVFDYYRNQKMGNKPVNIYPFSIGFVPECYKTHEIC